jgi:hypothetical protein
MSPDFFTYERECEKMDEEYNKQITRRIKLYPSSKIKIFEEVLKNIAKDFNASVKQKPKISKEYIKGFKHGVNWALIMAKCEVNKHSGSIGQGELGSLEIGLENIFVDSKEAIKSLKKGR